MAERQARTRGEYRFPYHRLDNCLEVARVIEDRGAGRLRRPDLAREMNSTVTSSSFEMRLVSARLFGLILRNGESYETTALAKRILSGSEQDRTDGLLEAFRSVPLFDAALTRFDGMPMPSDDMALAAVLESDLGVKKGEGSRARQLLMGSAQVAGLVHAREGKRWLVSAPVRERPRADVGDSRELPPPPPPPPPGRIPAAQLGWPPIDPQVLADWDTEKIKVYMEGLEKIARALRGEPPAANGEDASK